MVSSTLPGNGTVRRLLEMNHTPQYHAFEWLLEEERNGLLANRSEDLLVQRYVVAVLYFATNGPSWTKRLGFLSNTSECSWSPTAIKCDDHHDFVDASR